MTAILDIQSFAAGGQNAIIKELSVIDVEKRKVHQWTFKTQKSRSARGGRRRGASRRDMRRLYWEEGEAEFSLIPHILYEITKDFNFLFAKGHDKCYFFNTIFREKPVSDLITLGCPPLKDLNILGPTIKCDRKKHENPNLSCAVRNVLRLADWYRREGQKMLLTNFGRARTFVHMKKSLSLQFPNLAERGYYYSGVRDIVVCWMCGVGFRVMSSNPDEDHDDRSPNCYL